MVTKLSHSRLGLLSKRNGIIDAGVGPPNAS